MVVTTDKNLQQDKEFCHRPSTINQCRKSTTTTARKTTRKTEVMMLMLRGPLLFLVATLMLIVPYLVQMSFRFTVLVGIATVGFLLFCYDTGKFLESKVRIYLRTFLHGFVLDDFLKSIHDPETGVVATTMGCLIGPASMYALPMTPEHRSKLTAAAFWTSQEQGTKILLSPGGLIELLPERVQTWLEHDDDDDYESDNDNVVSATIVSGNGRRDDNTTTGTPTSSGSENSSATDNNDNDNDRNNKDGYNDYDDPTSTGGRTLIKSRGMMIDIVSPDNREQNDKVTKKCQKEDDNCSGRSNHRTNHNRQQEQRGHPMESSNGDIVPTSTPMDPIQVMSSILFDICKQRMRPYMDSIPNSIVENVTIVGSGILLCRFLMASSSSSFLTRRKKSNAKVTMWYLLSIEAFILSSVSAGGFSALLSKRLLLGNDGIGYQSLQKNTVAVFKQLLEKVKQSGSRYWKVVLAILMLKLGQMRKR